MTPRGTYFSVKFGICSEIFNPWNDIHRTIDYVKQIGYDGLEIAPFSLAPRVTDISASARDTLAAHARRAGLEIIGIHWVLLGPDGLHINHPDPEVRRRTAEYLVELVHFCGDLGGKIIVFGSPKQRNILPPLSREQAIDYTVAAFESALPACEQRGVTLCIEPLSKKETNFCCSAAEAVRLIERVGHPNFRLILDTKAMTDEPEGRPAVIRQYAPYLAHYHANDPNLEGPGFGDLDFASIFDALKSVNYHGYVSVEVFKFDPGPEAIAAKSLEYLKRFV